MGELWIIFHDIAVGCIRYENDLSLGERLEVFREEIHANGKSG